MNSYREWYADGTFDISPTYFKQVYSIHIIINGTVLPLVYGLLPNKSQKTYVKFLSLLKDKVSQNPTSVNCDFEKAVMNAFQNIFKCEIHGCFFHLSQAWHKKIELKIEE